MCKRPWSPFAMSWAICTHIDSLTCGGCFRITSRRSPFAASSVTIASEAVPCDTARRKQRSPARADAMKRSGLAHLARRLGIGDAGDELLDVGVAQLGEG